jgi:hypothetical protein
MRVREEDGRQFEEVPVEEIADNKAEGDGDDSPRKSSMLWEKIFFAECSKRIVGEISDGRREYTEGCHRGEGVG